MDISLLTRVIEQRQAVIDSIPIKEQEINELKVQENDIQEKIDKLEKDKELVSKKADTIEQEIASIDVEQLNKDIAEAQAIIDYFNAPVGEPTETTDTIQ